MGQPPGKALGRHGGVVDAACVVWAKTSFDQATGEHRWLPLWQHLDDTAAVAGRLWDHWLTTSLRSLCAQAFGAEQRARRLVTFLAATHDVGKATPAFALAVSQGWVSLNDRMARAGLRIPPMLSAEDRKRLPHGLAGTAILRDWLGSACGWSPLAADQLAVVIGGHHGVPPDVPDLRSVRGALGMGDGSWLEVQRHFVQDAADRSGAARFLPDLADVEFPQPVQVLLTGLVIMADWIASNTELFPHVLLDVEPRRVHERKVSRVERALAELDLPAPWRPMPGDDPVDVRLRTRFGLAETVQARPVQHEAVHTAQTMALPGLLVIEAPMGEGKTEAALLAAEVLAARTGAGGCFVALPTQATTDAMFRRVVGWLSRLPDDVGEVIEADHSVLLAHGRAGLNPLLRELRWSRLPEGIGQDENADGATVLPFVHRWTAGNKKGPLADFVVGTIDQLLFTSLKARYLALRHLGVARKVVVIDEVHAYDAYMNVYLTRALEWLGAYGVPVILLSATLPSDRRQELCSAYGRGATVADSEARALFGNAADPTSTYPAVTFCCEAGWHTAAVTGSGHHNQVELQVTGPEPDVIAEILRERLREGGCALVVRNTVRAAQETYRALLPEYGQDIRLTHARFLGHHRLSNDASLLRDFGPPGPEGSRCRPQCAVVVGTQVVEQSLDVDFDVIVTDLAPADLLLQRIGRVHRHDRGRRPQPVATPTCVVLGVPEAGAPPEIDRASRRIYGAHLLLRTAALIRETLSGNGLWRIPDDIAPLVQAAYVDQGRFPEAWSDAMQEAETDHRRRLADQERAASTFRLAAPATPGEPIFGWVHAGVGDVDDDREGRAQVRDAPVTFEVILLRRKADGSLHVPDGDHTGAGREVPATVAPPSDLARVIAGCTVRLPPWCAAEPLGTLLLEELEQRYFAAWQRDPHLGGQLVLPLDEVDSALRATVAGLQITYRRDTGLEVRRNDD